MKNLSRKEAMEILNGMKVKIEIPKAAVTQNKRNAALDMAINALNCSEIPNNSDAISRTQAIDALRAMQTYKLFAGDDMLLIDQAEAQTELMMLPSAQPEHMHTVMLKIAEKYEKAMNTSCILNPMAWALYQTWKEYDR